MSLIRVIGFRKQRATSNRVHFIITRYVSVVSVQQTVTNYIFLSPQSLVSFQLPVLVSVEENNKCVLTGNLEILIPKLSD